MVPRVVASPSSEGMRGTYLGGSEQRGRCGPVWIFGCFVLELWDFRVSGFDVVDTLFLTYFVCLSSIMMPLRWNCFCWRHFSLHPAQVLASPTFGCESPSLGLLPNAQLCLLGGPMTTADMICLGLGSERVIPMTPWPPSGKYPRSYERGYKAQERQNEKETPTLAGQGVWDYKWSGQKQASPSCQPPCLRHRGATRPRRRMIYFLPLSSA